MTGIQPLFSCLKFQIIEFFIYGWMAFCFVSISSKGFKGVERELLISLQNIHTSKLDINRKLAFCLTQQKRIKHIHVSTTTNPSKKKLKLLSLFDEPWSNKDRLADLMFSRIFTKKSLSTKIAAEYNKCFGQKLSICLYTSKRLTKQIIGVILKIANLLPPPPPPPNTLTQARLG